MTIIVYNIITIIKIFLYDNNDFILLLVSQF